MSDSDKMRQVFEAEARVIGLSLFPMKGKGEYWNDETNLSWRVWQAAYAAGQESIIEAMQKELHDWKVVLAAMVISNGGELYVEDRGSAKDANLEWWRDESNRRWVFRCEASRS